MRQQRRHSASTGTAWTSWTSQCTGRWTRWGACHTKNRFVRTVYCVPVNRTVDTFGPPLARVQIDYQDDSKDMCSLVADRPLAGGRSEGNWLGRLLQTRPSLQGGGPRRAGAHTRDGGFPCRARRGCFEVSTGGGQRGRHRRPSTFAPDRGGPIPSWFERGGFAYQ